jgi:hypothetical protein
MLTKDFLTDSPGLGRGSAFFGTEMVDKLVEPGESLVGVTSNNAFVRAHAALKDDGGLAIMLLNLHQTETADAVVNINDFLPAADGVMYRLTGGTSLSQSMIGGVDSVFTINLPTRSITTLLISRVPEPSTLTLLYVALAAILPTRKWGGPSRGSVDR